MARAETMEVGDEEVIVFWTECPECGLDYPIGGDVDGPDPETPGHHDPNCPVRHAKIQVGQWEDPDA